ncbi:MAG: hypothetical protein KBS81_04050, partial [Spirochaetales bacterium]|nr:hypothetical protein [Candidatus Physcosoma equi]
CLCLSLSARHIEEEPLFLEFLAMEYKDYTTESDYAYVLMDHPEYKKASLTYGKEYVEYALEKDEHEMVLFLTEEGSIYSLDGLVLDTTKPSLENQTFASLLEELQTLLRDSQDLFLQETTTVFSGKGEIEEIPLNWKISFRTLGDTAYLTYTYAFLQGSTFIYKGSIPLKEMKGQKDLLKIAQLEAFSLDETDKM